MVMPAQTVWTAEEARQLPDDGNRYEVVDGELLVSPSPQLPHQEAVSLIEASLRAFLKREPIGRALHSPADIEFNPRTLVQPDVFVAPLFEGRRPRNWTEISTLLLAVEVLSPSTARYDRWTKRRLFQREGVPEYWIVDLDARVVERWRPADTRPEIVSDSIIWHPAGAATSLTIDLVALFAEVHDD